MSALGQKQTFAVQNGMSALPLKADIRSALAHVRFVNLRRLLSADLCVSGRFQPCCAILN